MNENENTITFTDLLRVIFNRTKLLLIVTLGLFILATIGIYFHNKLNSTYEGMFSYSIDCYENGYYYEGTKFEYRDLVSLESLNKYQKQYESLKGLDMAKLYDKGAIESIEWDTLYDKNVAKMNEEDNDYVVKYKGFKVTLKKHYFSLVQAKDLLQAIAKEPNVISNQLIDEKNYDYYIQLFDSSTIFENKITYLRLQLNLIDSRYDELLDNFGNITVKDGRELQEIKTITNKIFENYNLEQIETELNNRGYVLDYTTYYNTLIDNKTNLENKKHVDELKYDDLTQQRDTLLQNSGTLYSIEIESYNKELIRLTSEIRDFEEEIRLIEIKINNYENSKTDQDFIDNVQKFNSTLTSYKQQLVEATKELKRIESEVFESNSSVYYYYTTIVLTVNKINRVLWIAVAFIISLLIGICVNLVLDFNKIDELREKCKQKRLNEAK